MQYLQFIVLAIASAALFVHLMCGASLLSTKTKIHVYLPLCLLISLDVGVFVCSIAGLFGVENALNLSKSFAALAFVMGGLYSIVIYYEGIRIYKDLNKLNRF